MEIPATGSALATAFEKFSIASINQLVPFTSADISTWSDPTCNEMKVEVPSGQLNTLLDALNWYTKQDDPTVSTWKSLNPDVLAVQLTTLYTFQQPATTSPHTTNVTEQDSNDKTIERVFAKCIVSDYPKLKEDGKFKDWMCTNSHGHCHHTQGIDYSLEPNLTPNDEIDVEYKDANKFI